MLLNLGSQPQGDGGPHLLPESARLPELQAHLRLFSSIFRVLLTRTPPQLCGTCSSLVASCHGDDNVKCLSCVGRVPNGAVSQEWGTHGSPEKARLQLPSAPGNTAKGQLSQSHRPTTSGGSQVLHPDLQHHPSSCPARMRSERAPIHKRSIVEQ